MANSKKELAAILMLRQQAKRGLLGILTETELRAMARRLGITSDARMALARLVDRMVKSTAVTFEVLDDLSDCRYFIENDCGDVVTVHQLLHPEIDARLHPESVLKITRVFRSRTTGREFERTTYMLRSVESVKAPRRRQRRR